MNPLGATTADKNRNMGPIGASPKAPENGWLEDDPSFSGRLPARCELPVLGRVNIFFS